MQTDRGIPLNGSVVSAVSPWAMRLMSVERFDVVLVAVAVGLYVLMKDVPIGHDQSWYLISAHKILAGARPYVDLIELNPPLNFYLMTPPVFFAERFGVQPEHAFVAYVIALACVSTLWARRLLMRLPAFTIVYANIAALIALLSTTALVVYDFGQRDVLMVIFTLPYLVLAMCRIEDVKVSRASAIAIGLWAALGICLKHYFLVFVLATELGLYFRRRRVSALLRPEPLTVGIAGAAYLVVVVMLFPEYLGTIVPMARATYFAYGIHFPLTVMCAEPLTLPLVLGAYIVLRRQRFMGAWLDMLAAWSVAAFVSYFIQDRGFTYHAEPLRIYMVFLAASVVLRRFDVPVHLPRFCLLAGLVLVGIRVEVLGFYDNIWPVKAKEIVERYGAKDGIYTFTAHMFIGFPLTNYVGSPWASRFNCLWPVPGAARILAAPENFTPAQRAEAVKADRYVTEAVVEDFEQKAPSLVIVDARKKKSYFADVKFDYVAHFMRDPRFAHIWQDYRRVAKLAGFEFWQKVRSDPAVSAR